jgi:hypothetical protein
VLNSAVIVFRFVLHATVVPPDVERGGMFPPSVPDTQAIELIQNFRDRLLQRPFHRLAQAAARFARLKFNSHREGVGGPAL